MSDETLRAALDKAIDAAMATISDYEGYPDTNAAWSAFLAAAPAKAEGLDEAWALAEAALPEGWHLLLSASPNAGNDAYARSPNLNNMTLIEANGPTPAAALRALADRLAAGEPEPPRRTL